MQCSGQDGVRCPTRKSEVESDTQDHGLREEGRCSPGGNWDPGEGKMSARQETCFCSYTTIRLWRTIYSVSILWTQQGSLSVTDTSKFVLNKWMQQKWSHHVKEISIPAATRTQCWGESHTSSVLEPEAGLVGETVFFPSPAGNAEWPQWDPSWSDSICIQRSGWKWRWKQMGTVWGQDSALTFPFTLASKWETHQIGYRTT